MSPDGVAEAEACAVNPAALLLAAALASPLVMLLACLSGYLRTRMPSLLWLAPLPALAATLLAPNGSTLVLPQALLGLTFTLDVTGAMLLGTAAILWSIAGVFAGTDLQGRQDSGGFTVWWLATLTGSLGVFIAADLVSFYLLFTLLSLATYGLVAYDGTAAARRAGAVYVALALLCEALLLFGFVLLAAATPDGSLSIRDTVATFTTSPWRDSTLVLLILGFGLKIGLVPLHIWMPSTYAAAPIPAAAVLSGAAVNAGVIGLIRFLPFETALPGWGEAIAAIGLFSAFYGVAIGLTQANPKVVLAYSSVSQMGLLAAVLGMGLATGDKTAPAAAAFYAAHHALVKGGLFLSVGMMMLTRSRGPWPLLLPAAVLALALAGLPLTGGALAKLAVKTPLGAGTAGTLAALSAIGTTLLMLHFLHRLKLTDSTGSAIPSGLTLSWLGLAFASIVVPWALSPTIATTLLRDALTPANLFEVLWPIALGGVLALVLHRWQRLLPHVPEGDILVAGIDAARRAARNLGAAVDRLERNLRQWPIATTLLLTTALILAGTMIVRH
jgi:formate hydrogenlyase subunit 3/multisubunit Na+/H+ antiporter MnhD subunit